jgi:hypothetical protein
MKNDAAHEPSNDTLGTCQRGANKDGLASYKRMAACGTLLRGLIVCQLLSTLCSSARGVRLS